MAETDQQRPLLHIDHIKTTIPTKKGIITPVDGVEIIIPRGKTVGLVGESGCGKSMTAMSVMGLVAKPGKVTQGEILLDGEDMLTYSKAKLRQVVGNRISIIFQEPMTSLNPVVTVGRQVLEAITLHNKDITKAQAKQRVIDIFRQVGIPEAEERYRAFPFQLSGGLRQRIMIGMAMACNPELLIADEPTTALDVTIEAQILHLMRKLQKEKGTSILMITHNLGVVAELCDYVYVMYAGKVVEYTEIRDLFRNPLHPYTIGLLNSLPKITGDCTQRLYSIEGMVPPLTDLPIGCRFCPRCDHATERCQLEEPDLYDRGDGHLVRCFLHETEQGGDA